MTTEALVPLPIKSYWYAKDIMLSLADFGQHHLKLLSVIYIGHKIKVRTKKTETCNIRKSWRETRRENEEVMGVTVTSFKM